jgi:hypothetical protein
VDPVRDPLLLRKFGSSDNRTRTYRSVSKNPVHWAREIVDLIITDRTYHIYKVSKQVLPIYSERFKYYN